MKKIQKHTPVFRAFIDSLPVLMGYLTMGFAAGVLLYLRGGVSFAWIWGAGSSAFCISGALQFLLVEWIANSAGLAEIAMLTICLNIRYAMYGISLISRFRQMPLLLRIYLTWGLTDETYALEVSHQSTDPGEDIRYCTSLTLMNHFYWIAGVTAGAIAGSRLPFPARGIEFAMLALFLVILTDQCRENANRLPASIGLCSALIALWSFGVRWMLIAAMVLMLSALMAVRKVIEKNNGTAVIENE